MLGNELQVRVGESTLLKEKRPATKKKKWEMHGVRDRVTRFLG